MNKEVIAKFNDSYHVFPWSGCWVWIMGTNQSGRTGSKIGYGMMLVNGKQTRAHRISYLLHKGKIPKGKQICHACDVPFCVNPDHLFIGTAKENAQDAISKGRWRAGWHNKAKTHCVHGHHLFGKNLIPNPRGWRICKTCHIEIVKRST